VAPKLLKVNDFLCSCACWGEGYAGLYLIISFLAKGRLQGYFLPGSLAQILFAEKLKMAALNPLSYTNQTVTPLRGVTKH